MLAKTVARGFFEVVSQTLFLVLQTDSKNQNPPTPKKRKRRHSVDSSTQQSQIEFNLLHRIFENFYNKFSYHLHSISNKHRASTLLTSISECYEQPIESEPKPDFKSLHFNFFNLHKHRPLYAISNSKNSCDDDPENQEILEELILNLPSTRKQHLFCFRDTTVVNSTPHHVGSPIPSNIEPTKIDLVMLDVKDILPQH